VDAEEEEMLKKAMKGVIGTVPITPNTSESRAVFAKCQLLYPGVCDVDDSYMYYAYDAIYALAFAMNDIIQNSSLTFDGATLLQTVHYHSLSSRYYSIL
jgi:ABC-type branched-subunit amino acid transport system substrate-binding protein